MTPSVNKCINRLLCFFYIFFIFFAGLAGPCKTGLGKFGEKVVFFVFLGVPPKWPFLAVLAHPPKTAFLTLFGGFGGIGVKSSF